MILLTGFVCVISSFRLTHFKPRGQQDDEVTLFFEVALTNELNEPYQVGYRYGPPEWG